MKSTECLSCRNRFEYEPFEYLGREMPAPKMCQTCSDSHTSAEKRREELSEAQARFVEVCPPLYQNTDISRLPERFQIVVAKWEYNPIGIGFTGKPGIGKTRAAYMIIQKCAHSGRTVAAVTSTRLNGLGVAQFSMEAQEQAQALGELRRIHETDLLLLDDIGKGKMTERAEMELYDLLEHRTSHQLPTIWTSNSGSDVLVNSMSKDRGPAILRRLAEFSEVIR
jgi:DNA replication protein DnaC